MLQAGGRHVQEVKRDEDIGFRHVLETAPLHQTHGRVDNCLCGKSVGGTVFQTENIANQVESPDLAAAVGQELIAANRTLQDLVDVVRGLRFTVDLGASIVLEFA